MSLIPEWSGLSSFPPQTQSSFAALLDELKSQNYTEATVLVLGKGGMGKSSTINSLLGERAVNITVFQADRDIPVRVSRQRAGFILNIIDTPGLVESGAVNEANLERIVRFCTDKQINAVLYVDRLDGYRIDALDRQIIKAITAAFGPKIWDISCVVLTHANIPTPSDGRSYSEYTENRKKQFQDLIKREGKGAWWKFWEGVQDIPVLFVENSSRVPSNENGEKILPSGDVFLVKLVEGIVDAILFGGSGLKVSQSKKFYEKLPIGKLLIPFALIAQYHFVVKPIQRQIRKDKFLLKKLREPWEIRASREIESGVQADTVRKIQVCKEAASQPKLF